MLSITINNLHFPNPFLLASGILDESADTMFRIIKHGAGGVVTKSIGMKKRGGYQNPVIYELPYGLINAMGLPNPGIEAFGEEMKKLKNCGVPVIGSIFGGTTDEFVYLAKKMENYGADAVELNLSCPHAKGYGMEIGVNPNLVAEIVGEVKKSVSIPVWCKLTPNVTDIVEIAKAADKADALVMINTLKAIAIDIEAQRPVLSNTYGGLSGPCVKPVGLRAVYDVFKEVDKPIIGVGGVSSWTDALEYFMAGASAVQIGTAIATKGPTIFAEISRDVADWLKKHGYDSIKDVVGVAHR